MPTNLEIIGINERSGLVTPNLYRQNWTTPNNTTNNYGVLHTRALSDTTTPIYGKGTGLFLDTLNGGGDYDINGNQINFPGSGRLNAIGINTAQWSYGPATPYSVNNTRALSDTTTPIYGKGTGLFLDTLHGGGSYDINGNIDYVGSGRLNAIGINTAQWSYGPATPYSVINTRALSDSITPVYGKGTGLFLDTANGGGSYDINGNQTNFPGSGRVPLMNYNFAIWTFGPTNNYSMSHPHALRPNIIPTATNSLGAGDVLGKGTDDAVLLDPLNEFVLPAHTNYVGGSWDDIISRDRNIENPFNVYRVDVTAPIANKVNWYTVDHINAISNTGVHGKGTRDSDLLTFINDYILDAHTNYSGGSSDDIATRNTSIGVSNNLYRVDVTAPIANKVNWYTIDHINAISNTGVNGKGTKDSVLLSTANDFILDAHTNYSGGSSDDIGARNASIGVSNNEYRVDISSPNSNTYSYTMLHPNALANGDVKGKGTNDGMSFDNTYAAHENYGGGSSIDINGNPLYPGSGRNASNANNSSTGTTPTITIIGGVVSIVGSNKPFGYGFNSGEGYTAPLCDGTGGNVGAVYYP